MRLLLDTHVVIWLYQNAEKVPDRVLNAIADADEVCVSLASAWEYELKRAKYRDVSIASFEEMITDTDFAPLDLPFALHVAAYELPAIHKDPFDRMLIAHADHLNCPLVTIDKTISRYPIEILW